MNAPSPPTRHAALVIALLLGVSFSLAPAPAAAQQAEALDPEAARAGLSVKPRNPVKNFSQDVSPIVRRTYERRPDKGIEVEIIHREDGSTEEHPFVPLPILFVVNSDELLDAVSRENVEKMAKILADLASSERGLFQVQGHTSAEGGREHNQRLSERRAARLQALLAARGVPAEAMEAIGLGPDCARFPASAPESQRQQDRRVLIVRMR